MTNTELLNGFRSSNTAEIRKSTAYCLKRLLPAVLRFLQKQGSEKMGLAEARQILKESITDFWEKCQDSNFHPDNSLNYIVGMYRNKWRNEINRYHSRHDFIAPVKDTNKDEQNLTPFDQLQHDTDPLKNLLGHEKQQQNVRFFKYIFREIITEPEDKKILLLCFVEGLKPREIAKRLNKKPNTVSKRIFDLKNKIKKNLKQVKHRLN